jgi:hypothetical protein
MQNIRHGRFALFVSPSVPGGSNTTIPGLTDLGTYQCGGFSRFVGMFSTVRSMTLRWQIGAFRELPGEQLGGHQQRRYRSGCNQLWPLRELHGNSG